MRAFQVGNGTLRGGVMPGGLSLSFLSPSFQRKRMPMKLTEKFHAMSDLPNQMKATTIVSVAAFVIALIALGVVLGSVRNAR